MRAYMSGTVLQPAERAAAFTGYTVAQERAALAEARAILAETEPGGWDGTQSTAEPYRRPTYHPQDADTALAEALAGFIEAEA